MTVRGNPVTVFEFIIFKHRNWIATRCVDL
jgi:hypothetical protein